MCAVLDLCGKAVLAWKIGADMSSSLVTDTIREALKREKATGGLALHSDQGSQYTSQAYFDLMQAYHVSPSMSSPGCPYDNAAMENFFGTLKTECLYRTHFTTRTEVEQPVTEYVDFYNFERISLKNGLTPVNFGARPCKLSLFYDRAFISLSVAWGTVHTSIGAIFAVAGFGSALHYIPSPTILSSHDNTPAPPNAAGGQLLPLSHPLSSRTSCPNQNDPQQIPPLPMGVSLHLPRPTPLPHGIPRGPKNAAGGRLLLLSRPPSSRTTAQPERNAANPPPARRVGLRLPGAKGTGRRHCRHCRLRPRGWAWGW